jgi:hypothetical protein
MTFSAHGKEVLKDGLHFADARSHKAAIEIVAAFDAASNLQKMQSAQRASIAAMIEAEGEKRWGRAVKRMARMLADAVRAGFDESDEVAPAGERARYNDQVAAADDQVRGAIECVPTVKEVGYGGAA